MHESLDLSFKPEHPAPHYITGVTFEPLQVTGAAA